MQYEKNSFLLVLTFMVVVTVQRLPIWWCEEKEKVVWGKRIYEGLSLKQGNSMSLYYYAVPVGARVVEGPEVDQSKSFLFPLSIPV